MISKSVIKVEGLGKKYVIGAKKDESLRGTLAALFSRGSAQNEEFWALKDVSFDIQDGDIVGIIGKNGAGKSTLLKILSKITTPSTGTVQYNGRIASLLEVGTGFHPELTGRENVYLNGTLLGMSRKEVAQKFEEIVDFSGVRKFIDTPVKRYSSGQYVRLAFAVAAHLDPEILIIDEVLAVGDAEFQKKCLGKMKDVADRGRTVIFVSHNMASIQHLCTRGIVMNNGRIDFIGETEKAIDFYLNHNEEIDSQEFPIKTKLGKLLSVETLNANFEQATNFLIGQEFKIRLNFENNSNSNIQLNVRYKIFNSKGELISTVNTFHQNAVEDTLSGKRSTILFELPKINFKPDRYNLSINLLDLMSREELINADNFLHFIVDEGDYYNSGKLPISAHFGAILLDGNWSCSTND